MNSRPYLASVLLAGAIAPLWAAQPAPKPPTTVGDLPKRVIEVHTGAVVSGGSAKAMESYRHFLRCKTPTLSCVLRRCGASAI
jgi:hypothetical protein